MMFYGMFSKVIVIGVLEDCELGLEFSIFQLLVVPRKFSTSSFIDGVANKTSSSDIVCSDLGSRLLVSKFFQKLVSGIKVQNFRFN